MDANSGENDIAHPVRDKQNSFHLLFARSVVNLYQAGKARLVDDVEHQKYFILPSGPGPILKDLFKKRFINLNIKKIWD
jgi:hypothetical protein